MSNNNGDGERSNWQRKGMLMAPADRLGPEVGGYLALCCTPCTLVMMTDHVTAC